MVQPNYTLTKKACYVAYFTMSSVFSLPPLLFVTFHDLYDISYTLLGTLVLTNFCVQLAVDLVFTAFPKYFNVARIVRIMPLITTLGLLIYGIIPVLLPGFAYGGLLLGTVIFSLSAGLSEALLSPVIAAIPSENPQRDMSTLHSLYAFGVLTVVVVSTLFLEIFGRNNWMYLTVFLALWPVLAAAMFARSNMPDMQQTTEGKPGFEKTKKRIAGLALCVGCIFFGSCAENTMSNWISSFMESALGVDKVLGDILGMAMFAVLLGIVRISYAKFGKRIEWVLLPGMIGAVVCYLVAGLSSHALVAFIACIFTGLFTSMLWPGTLILMEENIPGVGVTAFALMAAGGDMGASFAPQLMGVVIDQVSASEFGIKMAAAANIPAEQVGMKVGMLVSAIFPVLGTLVLFMTLRFFKKHRAELT